MQPYRISTITAVGHVTCGDEINLQELYDSLEVIEQDANCPREGFTYAEYNIDGTEQNKGFHRKKTIIRRKISPKKRFEGYASCLMAHMFNGIMHSVNVKIFRKGILQITGLKSIDQGHMVIERVADHIRNACVLGRYEIVSGPDVLRPGGLRVCLINSDFIINGDNGERATIIREKLYRILQNEYSTFCQFDAVVHPSVRANFFYNSWNDSSSKNGLCECVRKCYGKGTGCGDGECKKITIAVFGSGCVIITGAQSFVQLDAAYAFICKVIKKHYKDFIKTDAQSSQNYAPVEMSRAAIANLMHNYSH